MQTVGSSVYRAAMSGRHVVRLRYVLLGTSLVLGLLHRCVLALHVIQRLHAKTILHGARFRQDTALKCSVRTMQAMAGFATTTVTTVMERQSTALWHAACALASTVQTCPHAVRRTHALRWRINLHGISSATMYLGVLTV